MNNYSLQHLISAIYLLWDGKAQTGLKYVFLVSFYELDMRLCPLARDIPLPVKCNYLFPFVCFCFPPHLSALYSFPVLSYARLLPLGPLPSHKYGGISVIYSPQGLPVILTTPL